MTITFAQIDYARTKARRGLSYIAGNDLFTISMYDDDRRLEAAQMYLSGVMGETVAGHRRYTFVGDQAQVDSYIQAVIGALT